MKIAVRYFASVRDALGRGAEQLDVPESAMTVALLRAHLATSADGAALARCRNLRCAVNQAMADDATVVADGDEVAFFPPVTGG